MNVAVFCRIGISSQFLRRFDTLKYRCDYDQCSYGLRTPYGEHWRATRRLQTTLSFVGSLSQRCHEEVRHARPTARRFETWPRTLSKKFMDILDKYGAMLVRQEMVQPLAEEESMNDYPSLEQPVEPAAQPDEAEDRQGEPAYAEQKQRHLRQDHVPFAAWCRVCVQAKGRDKTHRRVVKEPVSALPLLGLDYCYLGTVACRTSITTWSRLIESEQAERRQ